MAGNKLRAPKNILIDFKPSPRQYELWKLLQPNYCPLCGGDIEQVLVGYDITIILSTGQSVYIVITKI